MSDDPGSMEHEPLAERLFMGWSPNGNGTSIPAGC